VEISLLHLGSMKKDSVFAKKQLLKEFNGCMVLCLERSIEARFSQMYKTSRMDDFNDDKSSRLASQPYLLTQPKNKS
jgi:hypothetical protein